MNGKPLLKDKDKPKKERKKTSAKLKKELDSLLSKYIRQKYADDNGELICYTCGWRGHWKKLHNGHLVSRYYLNTRFDERNCRPQCITCNLWRNGMTPHFAEKLSKELGVGIVEELYREARKIIKDFPYQEKIDHYTKLLSEYEKL